MASLGRFFCIVIVGTAPARMVVMNTDTYRLCSARPVNPKGCMNQKMGIVSINGQVFLAPQLGEKLRISRKTLWACVATLGLPVNSCIRFG